MSQRSKAKPRARKPVATYSRAVRPQARAEPTKRGGRGAALGVSVFLAVITWIVFGQTVYYDFVNVDDGNYVVNNLEVTGGLTLRGILWAFTHVHSFNWHPVTWISHMLDCQFHGLSPGGHHLTNVLLHATTAILLFLVLRQMTAAFWRSAFVAAIFAIHPLRVESVAWVAERKDVLSGLFFVLTIGAYVRYARRPWSPRRYGLVALLLALGLMCKPMLVTLPVVLLLLDYWPLHRFAASGDRTIFRIPRRMVLEKLPLLALSVVSCIATVFAQKGAIQPIANVSLPLRVGNALISSVTYLGQLLWPSDLAAFYPFPTGNIWLPVVLSFALFAGISAGVFFLRRHRYLVTGWLWYLIMLAPVLGILQVGSQARADRYTYLPQIGLCLLLTWTAADLSARWRHRRPFLGALGAAIVVAFIFTARQQTSYWRSSELLWTHAIACTSDNAFAQVSLGEALYERGKLDQAMGHYQMALQINPNEATALSALGLALLESGRPHESVAHLQRALEIDPNFTDAHYNLGNAFLQLGRASEALHHYGKGLESNPDDIEALNNMAWILATWPAEGIRDGPKAVELAGRADSLTWKTNPVVAATLAASYAEAGAFAEAVKTSQRALQLASAQSNRARADLIRSQIELYQSGAAFRDRRSTDAH